MQSKYIVILTSSCRHGHDKDMHSTVIFCKCGSHDKVCSVVQLSLLLSGVFGAPILFSEIGFCVASCIYIILYVYIYIIIYIYICQDGGAVGFVDLLSFHSLCLHLRSHLTKWEVLQNTSS